MRRRRPKKTLPFLVLCIGVAIGIGFILDLHDNAKFLVKLAALILAPIAISVVAARIFRPRVLLRGFAINAGVAIVAITMGLAAAEFAIRYAYSDITTTANNEGYFSGRYRALNPRRTIVGASTIATSRRMHPWAPIGSR